MKTSGVVERMTVQPESLFYQEHEARYRFAETIMRPGSTLDIACGSAYGAHQLAQREAGRVVGADIFLPALLAARQSFRDPQLDFAAASGAALPFAAACFQNVVTLETLEHIAEAESYLQEICRVMHPAGVCVLSTPDREHSIRHNVVNPYHVHEHTWPELQSLLEQFFGKVEFFYQGFASTYHARVRTFEASIQSGKRKLSRPTRWAIDHVYHAVRQWVPNRLINLSVRWLIGLHYPRPEQAEISISAQLLVDAHTFVAVCRQPLQLAGLPASWPVGAAMEAVRP